MQQNIAIIDGQNLYMGTVKDPTNPWYIDFARFRVYLNDKYRVREAYYFFGYQRLDQAVLYRELSNAGFTLVFKKHMPNMVTQKKGNVDTDIVFFAMKKLYRKELLGRVVLVSGDGDFWDLVYFLISENRFERMLFPNMRSASSLYKRLPTKYYDSLQIESVRQKISKQNEGSP